MRTRHLLHFSHSEAFAAFMEGLGWRRVDTKGPCERMRFVREGEPPCIYYARDHAREHLTTFGQGTRMAARFLRERRARQAPDTPGEE